MFVCTEAPRSVYDPVNESVGVNVCRCRRRPVGGGPSDPMKQVFLPRPSLLYGGLPRDFESSWQPEGLTPLWGTRSQEVGEATVGRL